MTAEGSLRPEVWKRLARSRLFLDQTETRLELDRSQIVAFYHPLAKHLLSKAESMPRQIVAVAGPPGSGKTAFATILVAMINAESGRDWAVLVGLDGWHYPNSYLETHFVQRGGRRIPLREIKGAPESFDVAAAYDCLATARTAGKVRFPVYSRRLHAAVVAGGTIGPAHRIIVVEGNYLLLDEEPWRSLRQLFDQRLFITAGVETLVESLRERHLRGGKSPEAADQWIREVDLPNIERVAPGTANAQVLVHKADVKGIDRVEWIVATHGQAWVRGELGPDRHEV